MSAPAGSSRATVAAPLYFDLARINLDSTPPAMMAPAMMAPAITRIVVRSMFIDYPFYPWTRFSDSQVCYDI
jgi:hypothetical protein